MESDKLKAVKDFEVQTAVPVVECKCAEEQRVVCPVCGFANTKFTALCKMCSNYLMDD